MDIDQIMDSLIEVSKAFSPSFWNVMAVLPITVVLIVSAILCRRDK